MPARVPTNCTLLKVWQMTDNERIAEAMGWKKIIERPFSPRWIRLIDEGRPAPASASITHIYEGEAYAEIFGGAPDYVTDPALLSEMLDWLSERYGVVIEHIQFEGKFRGYWIAELYLRDAQVYVDDDDQNAELQQVVARCVCWELDQKQGLLDAQYGR